jgi:exopolysaccharide production protein ExoY
LSSVGIDSRARLIQAPRLTEISALWSVVHGVERVVACATLAALSPALIAVGGVIRLLSGSSPLVAHPRVGQNGAPLWMLKFRTMWERDSGGRAGLVEKLPETVAPIVKISDDPRVTSRFAAFCRKYSIDELPQLWHIVRGELSFVGPRPLTASELADYYGGAATEVLRLKPGLTGLWQISGRNRLSYEQRRKFDIFLARRFSLMLYLRILAVTPLRVLSGRDAW